ALPVDGLLLAGGVAVLAGDEGAGELELDAQPARDDVEGAADPHRELHERVGALTHLELAARVLDLHPPELHPTPPGADREPGACPRADRERGAEARAEAVGPEVLDLEHALLVERAGRELDA